MKKIILTALCLFLSLMFSYEIALGSDAISELHEQLSQKFPDLEEIRINFGGQAKWQRSTMPSPHDDSLELEINKMEYPGIEIITLGYTYENEDYFFINSAHVKEAGIVDFLGIDVGSARADVIKRFGKPSSIEGNKLSYVNESGYLEVIFIIKNNKVAEMSFNNYVD